MTKQCVSTRRWWVLLGLLCLVAAGCANIGVAEPSNHTSDAATADHTAHKVAEAPEGYAQVFDGYHGELVLPLRYVQDFTLPATFAPHGKFSDLDGHWRMVFFGYMHCPDFCPMTLVDFKLTQELLGETTEKVRFVYITIDGIRDEPEALARYLGNFSDKFVGYVGDPETLTKIQPDYGFYYSLRLADDPQSLLVVEHSAQSYLVDPYGRLHAKFAYHTDPQLIANAIQWHIEQDALDTCE